MLADREREKVVIVVKLIVIALTIGSLVGCAAIHQAQIDLAHVKMDFTKFAVSDVTKAIGRASQATDPGAKYRLRCYTTILAHILKASPTPPAIPAEGVGLAEGFEIAAELDYKLRSGAGIPNVPVDVQADCAYVEREIIAFGIRVGAIVSAGVASGGASLVAPISGAALRNISP